MPSCTSGIGEPQSAPASAEPNRRISHQSRCGSPRRPPAPASYPACRSASQSSAFPAAARNGCSQSGRYTAAFRPINDR